MKVNELIEVLKKMPQDAEVLHLWDGEPRTGIQFVWLAREEEDGKKLVITSDYDEVCYKEKNRPIGAPTVKQDRYWHTPTEEENNEFWELTKDTIDKYTIATRAITN